MIFCARATRGRGLPSLDARSGRPISPHPWKENERVWRAGTGAARCPSCSQRVRKNGTRADPLLPERARSECAHSTAAVGPTRVPFLEKSNEQAWRGQLDGRCSPGTRARLGALGVEWVRMLWTVKDSLGLYLQERHKEFGRSSLGTSK